MFRSVVIVGRPNVGKSRLFNRLARKRISIVHDQPGVTRDVISAEVDDGYTLMDTGGLGLKEGETSSAAIIAASERQVGFAIDTASLILFIIDGLDRVTALDDRIARRLRQGGKPVILVVNKADFGEEKVDHEGVSRLGLGDPIFVSAEHGRGETNSNRPSSGGSAAAGEARGGGCRGCADRQEAPGPHLHQLHRASERREVLARQPTPQERSPDRERPCGHDSRRDRTPLRV